ncbi:MAG: hypothetical protein GWO38_09410 [Phycisphaerae bacterium]|nr:hypothetical protein [Phycisphaerae bacterium]NIX27833.1 hypothetical protein [Phycisphaerae bacterium]
MKRYALKTFLAIVVLVTLQFFILNPAVAESDCNIVCEGSFVIDEIDTAADLETLSGCTTVTGDLAIEYLSLTSLQALKCLAHVGGNLVIWYNRALCTSFAEALKDRLVESGGTGGSINISMNKPGC